MLFRSTCGTVDELNSALGLAAVNAPDEIASIIRQLQSRLFDLGADLCTPPDANVKRTVRITAAHVTELEGLIDRVSAQLPPPKTFILPGGCQVAAHLHLARTIGRRAERRIVALSRKQTINANVMVYLNRVGDLLFALARRANGLAKIEDTPWLPDAPQQQ